MTKVQNHRPEGHTTRHKHVTHYIEQYSDINPRVKKDTTTGLTGPQQTPQGEAKQHKPPLHVLVRKLFSWKPDTVRLPAQPLIRMLIMTKWLIRGHHINWKLGHKGMYSGDPNSTRVQGKRRNSLPQDGQPVSSQNTNQIINRLQTSTRHGTRRRGNRTPGTGTSLCAARAAA